MSIFFLAFLSCALACLCGRDAERVAMLAAAHQRLGMLVLALALAAAGFALLGGFVADRVQAMLEGPGARLFVAFALAVAGLEILLLRPGKPPREPTFSLAATVIVLWAGLQAGSAGFLMLALAVFGQAPLAAAGGAGLGAFGALVLAALAGEDWARVPASLRRGAGACTLLGAAAVNGWLVFAPG